MKNQLLWCLLLLPILVTAAGCAGPGSAKPVNEMSFPLDGLDEVTIAYDEETVTYLRGDGDQLVVVEYMNKDKRSYHAKVTRRGGGLHISEGGKPLMRGGFYRYVEVYLPAEYDKALTTSTTSGDIDLSGVDMQLSAFHADTTSGRIVTGAVAADRVTLTTTSGEVRCGALSGEVDLETKSGVIAVQSVDSTGGVFRAHTTSGSYKLGRVDADRVEIKTTSGSVTCDEVSGRISYTTTSGDLAILSAGGSGSFEAGNQGKIAVAFRQVDGDLSLYNKNDRIDLALPAGLSFHFQGIARGGRIDTTFGAQLQMEGDTLTGDVGGDPVVTVRVETREGSISVTQ